jgi:hypothetical protein
MHSATLPTLELQGADRVRYFAPVVFFGFLAALCVALITITPFLVAFHDAIALAAAGIFGLLATAGVGVVILRLQLRWLRYTSVPISIEADTALEAVRRLAIDAGWKITRQAAGCLEAETPGTMFIEGERVSVRIREQQLLVASICDPQVGFSLTGHARCLQHCERVRQVVLNA